MIPRKVEVEGFFCYRDKQVVDLDGSDLWVFSGRNGSGKSTIFDAITFALFGRHRGGEKGLDNLINTRSAEFQVAFEFDLGPDRFKITRSLRRGGVSERRLCRREVDAAGNEHWYPVAETSKKEGLDRWVAQNVGLNYEMFTSSMMLRQGQAEKLLEATPKERFDIVAEVADLKSYQHLSRQADARRLERKSRLDGIRSLLAGKPEVDPLAIDAAEGLLREARAARASAEAERDRLVALEAQARHWRDLTEDRERAVEEANHARQVIATSARIEFDWNRLRDLNVALPILLEEAGRRAEVADREAALLDGQANRTTLERQLAELSALAEQSRRRRDELAGEIRDDEARQRAVGERLAELLPPMTRARAAAERRRAVADLEAVLATYPPDLEQRVAHLGEQVALCLGWKAALPSLVNLAEARHGLAGARSRAEAATEAVALAATKAQEAGDILESARSRATRAGLAHHEANALAAEARATLRSAQERMEVFEDMESSPACDRCGQPLTPEHFAAESRRRGEARDEAGRAADKAEGSLLAAQAQAEAAESAKFDADRLDREAGAALNQARADLEQATADAARHEAACSRAYGDLDEPFRSLVAGDPVNDWASTTYPTPDDLAEGRRLRIELPEAERLANEARLNLEMMRVDRSRLDEARRAVEAVALRPEDDQAEAEHATLSREATLINARLKDHRLQRDSADHDVDALSAKMDGVRDRFAPIDSVLDADRTQANLLRALSAKARAAIPGHWHDAFDGASREDLDAWSAERLSLIERNVEQLAGEIPKAQWALNAAQRRLAELDAKLAEISEPARHDPAEVAALREAAADRLATAEEDLGVRDRALDALRRDRDKRARLVDQMLEADRAHAVSAKLAELLGRGSLQRDLIRHAERGILDCANPILREVSGDDLELRLVAEDSEDDQALPLEVIDRTHGPGRTLGVAYLSGSQRFRVAVSLALGIGQYARGIDRPIQSVVIDEGFGCLDRQGRDEMIAQLTALKGRLARIVLVSHQEEFAEAFTDGYRFEIQDNSTVVQEYHR